jgi:ketosteroid isomerase-like protein
MSASDVELVRRAWSAFCSGDVEAIEAVLHPRVRWYPADEPGAAEACSSREQAIAFIRAAPGAGRSADLVDVIDAGERVVLILHRRRPPGADERPEPHGEVIAVRDGAIVEMVIHWSVGEALAAAGFAAQPTLPEER